MRNVSYLIIYIVTVVLFAACQGNKKYDMLMLQADSIMDSNDEAAKNSIKILDGIKPQFEDLSKRQQMRYQLLYHKAMNKADIPFTSDSTMKQVAEYYESHGTANDRMLAYYMLGCIYRDLREAPVALEYYNKATEQADTTSQDCDYATLCRVYSQMAMLFEKEHLPYQELSVLDKASHYAFFAKDTLNAILYFQGKSIAYYDLGKIDSAININLKCAKLFKSHGYNHYANIAFGCNYEYYIEKKDYTKAKEAFEAYKSSGFQGNSDYEDSKAFLLYEQGLYYMYTNKMDSAYKSFQESLKLSTSYSNKYAATKGLALCYLNKQDDKLAAKYALISSSYNDSTFYNLRKSQLYQMQSMYDYNRNQKIAQQAEVESKQRMNTIYIIIICSILAAIIGWRFYQKKLKKSKNKIISTKNILEESIQKLQIAKQELANLKNLNENKIKELIQEKESAIADLQKQVATFKSHHKEYDIQKINKQIKETAIYKKIEHINNHPKEKMKESDWEYLEETIKMKYPSFIDLKRKLNEKEYRICLLSKLQFSPTNISNLTGYSPSDISMQRKRLLKKICGIDGKAKDFDEYIYNI